MAVDNIGKSGPRKRADLSINPASIRADTLKKIEHHGLDGAIERMTRDVKLVTGEYKQLLKGELSWLQRRRRDEQALAEHTRRVATSGEAQEQRRAVAKRRVKVKPFDPEIGRYRTARPLGGASRRLIPGFEGYPSGARIDCPSCGVAPAGYLKYGRYICSVDRLNSKGIGCGHQWLGPMNPSELARLEERRRMGLGTTPPDPTITESMYPGRGYPPAPKEFEA